MPAPPDLRVYFAERPLRRAHLLVLRDTQDRQSNVLQHAGWANKSYASVVCEILGQLAQKHVLERVQLLKRPSNEIGEKSHQEAAELFVGLCVNMASQRAWSMSCNHVIQPNCWSGICDPDLTRAQARKDQIQQDAEIILNAYQKLKDGDPGADLKANG